MDILRASNATCKSRLPTQQIRYVGVLRTYGASELVNRPVCDLGNAVYFFLGER